MSLPGYWLSLELTANKRPVLIEAAADEKERKVGDPLESEIELMIEKDVSIYIGKEKVLRKGVATVTTHRILWCGKNGSPSHCLPLRLVDRLETQMRMMGFSSPKITMFLNAGTNAAPPQPDYMKLSFHGTGLDQFHEHIKNGLRAKAWENVVKEKVKKVFSTHSAGIGGLIKTTKEKAQKTDKTLEVAFKDLDALMDNAKNIVVLATKFRNSQEAKDQNDKDASVFNSMLLDLGIVSPVTKSSSGAAYHTSLARQLADFIAVPLKRSGGMMTTTAAFCLFNRARGTELISPDDMLQACRLFADLGLPVRLRPLTSGFMVLQLESMSDEAFAKEILTVIEERGKINAVALSQVMHVSLMLAKQRLLESEANGLLCRDESFEGLAFYLNFFK